MAEKPKRFLYICSTCGTSDVLRDAWASWNPEAQTWELEQTFDNAYCNQCEGEVSLECQEIAE